MLRFLQSIFGSADQGGYPESLVREALERAVDATDPQLRAVSGYRKKLRSAVLRAIDHVVALVDALPPPTPVGLGVTEEAPAIRSFFISAIHMRKAIADDPGLAGFLQGPEGYSPRVVALLAVEKQEKVILGAGLSGDIVIHDVPQVTVSFDGHRFLDPAASEEETRQLLKRRAYDHLLSLALRRLTVLKGVRSDLERRRALLQAKLNLLKRGNWGFDLAEQGEKLDAPTVEERLARIEEQLLELGGDDHVFEAYLEAVTDVLGQPAEYLRAESETIFVDRMGIKRSEAAADAPELRLNELYNAEGRSLVVTLVALSGEELRGNVPA
ncbi:hypothetical protein [Geobacter sp. SVR]|uniref:hypothetical protein n=1 Tax=Geobacter sp. SVR TaxID=2495594 RepID=UPI00143EF8D7|nr:hypothetical protein [Geobacter sp. SVR]BCS52897.1 hypothetical protein GSVR_12050 [Geobacter sp. SVR]GCF87519.1 hypothetical protein GSbR_41190 [Geobacter sp. SVR]